MSLSEFHQGRQNPNQDITLDWFATKRERYSDSEGNEILNGFMIAELEALQSLYEGETSAENTAISITNPISNSSVPFLGSYSDDRVAVTRLWHLLVEALISWPAARTLDLLALLRAIGKLRSSIHKGEALRDDGETPLPWSIFPHFSLAWFDIRNRWPGEIVMRAQGDANALESSRRRFIWRKDLEAQLIQSHVLRLDALYVETEVAKTFETEPSVQIPLDEAAADEQNRIEFQVPAVASLTTYVCQRIFEMVVSQERGHQRWESWEQRLEQIKDEQLDDLTRDAAKVALNNMQITRLGQVSHA